MTSINIREAMINDLNNDLLKIYIEGYKHHVAGRPDIFKEKSEEELKEELTNNINTNNVLILEKDNNIKGFIIYKINEKHSKILWIDQLVIDFEEQKKGYGRILMDKILEIARKEKCVRVELCCWKFNNNALSMYEHLGYKEQRRIFELDT